MGEKVCIIPEISRYLYFIFCSNIFQAEENPQAATAQQSLAVLKTRDQFNKILFAALVKKVCNYKSCLRSVQIPTKTVYYILAQIVLKVKKSKIQVFDTPQVVNCFKVKSDAALLPS